jgi:hypothetical protein
MQESWEKEEDKKLKERSTMEKTQAGRVGKPLRKKALK